MQYTKITQYMQKLYSKQKVRRMHTSSAWMWWKRFVLVSTHLSLHTIPLTCLCIAYLSIHPQFRCQFIQQTAPLSAYQSAHFGCLQVYLSCSVVMHHIKYHATLCTSILVLTRPSLCQLIQQTLSASIEQFVHCSCPFSRYICLPLHHTIYCGAYPTWYPHILWCTR